MAINFPEEQLNSHFGYFPGQPGQTLDNGAWLIIRKLGWGPRSSVWFAFDVKDIHNSVAIKILTVEATQSPSAKSELALLEKFHAKPGLPWFRGHFYEEGLKGKHLCLLLGTLGPSVETLRTSNEEGAYLPLHIVKQVVSSGLSAICNLHRENVYSGAIKAEHLLFPCHEYYGGESYNYEEVKDEDGTTYPVVRSEPLGTVGEVVWNESKERFASQNVTLTSIGSHNVGDPVSAADFDGPLTPPEVLTGGKIGLKVDIFQLGLMIFHLLTGAPLLDEAAYKADPNKVLSNELKNMAKRFKSNGRVAEPDIPLTVAILQEMLALNPIARPAAEKLLEKKWIEEGDVCSCGWCAA
ncbi:hypothetical protein GALMADRAFT_66277 [Galerina marginata CBS 339.88]|uniref:non-specific serine/threonine protein kinase n=1 Tax=Galerina marginata (strain CBS 339.88) TaxID=685588 RepID=A0A067T2B6_GALM3|nr:hypothetical protein GALMADRAFT_66277 [Galerina marginata CBS 339.88]